MKVELTNTIPCDRCHVEVEHVTPSDEYILLPTADFKYDAGIEVVCVKCATAYELSNHQQLLDAAEQEFCKVHDCDSIDDLMLAYAEASEEQ